jgi:hypothetical protein
MPVFISIFWLFDSINVVDLLIELLIVIISFYEAWSYVLVLFLFGI